MGDLGEKMNLSEVGIDLKAIHAIVEIAQFSVTDWIAEDLICLGLGNVGAGF